ncbi:MAG: protoglobin domain-containing protein [Mangrovicoccus sp.]
MKKIIASTVSQSYESGSADNNFMGWFEISDADRQNSSQLAPYADDVAEDIIESFYEHILAFPDAAQHFSSEDQIARVKKSQLRYFRELVNAEIDENYIRERRRIGEIHERAGISPTLYIGAFAYYLHRLGHIVLERMEDDPKRAVELFLSLVKIAHFDMSQALETFVESREATIEQREREISELPTPVLKLREGLLLIPVVGTLDSYRARTLTVQLLEGIRDYRARAVVLDITGVAAVDSAVANHLIQTMSAAGLMGASSVLTGLSAEVAQALVKIGVSGEALRTAGDLQHGIEMAEKSLES